MTIKLYTGGTYDCPHLGHYNFFRRCKRLFPNSILVVSLNTDEFVESYKGKKPLFSYEERYELLSNVNEIDRIIRNTGGHDSKPAIERVDPDVIVIGSDWLKKDYCAQMGFTPEWLEEQKIALCYITYTEGISTSEIKRRINAQ